MSIHTSHPAEDVRLVRALRARRPGAVGRVYDVHGPDLIEYAEELLGDHDRAVAAVRSALLSLRAGTEVPPPAELRDWLRRLVRNECQAPVLRIRLQVVLIGIVLGAVLAAGVLAALDARERAEPPAPATRISSY
ncbi:hypothetical protein [Actinomadura sp. WMMB 499]|uniref:hypothetical protein n=1 Tax=Actinomadura sp. WMMB 499 TaxID=1219491 RepID=UPI001245DA3B|nr:hypothetical protein [Actinomadura sp. WMMB 499]QFG20713.1 hypothetical protein F7P10_05680 [Actinomadura sp. WMMB 499]